MGHSVTTPWRKDVFDDLGGLVEIVSCYCWNRAVWAVQGLLVRCCISSSFDPAEERCQRRGPPSRMHRRAFWKWFKNSPYSKLLLVQDPGVRLLQSIEHPVLVSEFEKELRISETCQRSRKRKEKHNKKASAFLALRDITGTLLIFCSKCPFLCTGTVLR